MTRSRLRARIVEMEAFIEASTIRRVLALRCQQGSEQADVGELTEALAELESELGRRLAAEIRGHNGARA